MHITKSIDCLLFYRLMPVQKVDNFLLSMFQNRNIILAFISFEKVDFSSYL